MSHSRIVSFDYIELSGVTLCVELKAGVLGNLSDTHLPFFIHRGNHFYQFSLLCNHTIGETYKMICIFPSSLS